MSPTKVYLGRLAQQSTSNVDGLLKQAEALAASLTLPANIEFAKLEHRGKTYAISTRLSVEVELLTSRTPDVVIRSKAASTKRA
jgi:hypothetical protein